MSTAIPASPNTVNTLNVSATDPSIVNSTTGAGLSYFIPSESPIVSSNSHVVTTRADGAFYDITSAAYVSIQSTNCGTTSFSKNGQ